MNFRLVGINYQSTPLDVRETLAFSPEQVTVALQHWLDEYGVLEAVLLSTCNRTELYVASETEPLPGAKKLFEFLSREKKLAPDQKELLEPCLLDLEGRAAAVHLFSVAASLNSMVLGEPQILAQVKAAYQTALDVGSVGPITHGSFQAALRIAKLIASQTELYQRRVSIPSIAVVDFALVLFERLENKKTLLFGAGEMGEETLQYLREYGAREIAIANRGRAKAEELARKWSARTVGWEDRFKELENADILISTTGATEPVLTRDEFRRIELLRRSRPLFILDLGVPRDIEAAVGEFPDVYLYSLDDLKAACEKNRAARDKEIPKAKRIIEQETDRFLRDIRHRKTGPLIRRLREDWDSRKEEELRRLFNKLPELDEKGKEEIRYAFDRLLGKLLHPPLESLRDDIPHHEMSGFLETLARLFRLG